MRKALVSRVFGQTQYARDMSQHTLLTIIQSMFITCPIGNAFAELSYCFRED